MPEPTPRERLERIENGLRSALRTVVDLRCVPDDKPGAALRGSIQLVGSVAEMACQTSELIGAYSRRRKAQGEAML